MRLKSPAVLKALMLQEGLSLGALAKKAGCSKGFISHLLAERRFVCTPTLATAIAEALDVPADVLFAPTVSAPGRRTVNPKGKAA